MPPTIGETENVSALLPAEANVAIVRIEPIRNSVIDLFILYALLYEKDEKTGSKILKWCKQSC